MVSLKLVWSSGACHRAVLVGGEDDEEVRRPQGLRTVPVGNCHLVTVGGVVGQVVATQIHRRAVGIEDLDPVTVVPVLVGVDGFIVGEKLRDDWGSRENGSAGQQDNDPRRDRRGSERGREAAMGSFIKGGRTSHSIKLRVRAQGFKSDGIVTSRISGGRIFGGFRARRLEKRTKAAPVPTSRSSGDAGGGGKRTK